MRTVAERPTHGRSQPLSLETLGEPVRHNKGAPTAEPCPPASWGSFLGSLRGRAPFLNEPSFESSRVGTFGLRPTQCGGEGAGIS